MTAPLPSIDTHIHLFDPTRPQGVPWPPKENKKLYMPALPERYRKLAVPLGIVGAIKVEASPWLEDNQWVLDIAEKDPIIVGVVGNIEPGTPDFRKNLERFGKNRLFRGIRYGTLWGRNFEAAVSKAEVIGDLKALAAANMSMDTVASSPRVLANAVRLSDLVPDLRFIIDHLPSLEPPREPSAFRDYEATLRELAKRPQIMVKVSAVLRRVDGRVPTDPAFYKPRLDQIFDIFGEDRLMYGSDWPNSDNWGTYQEVFTVVREYFTAKGPAAAEKYFWRNSVRAYRWIHRAANQPKA
ncbi:MAG: amidohydrolase family protein [Bryobacteraceae bacterium]|nr:amidohydrolase family protein [Bryobacteraceae bacterium]